MYIVKQCPKCKEYKLLDEYHSDKSRAFGKRPKCKSCDKQYYQENKKRIKQYREENKERILKYVRHFYQENKASKKQYAKQYREENKERINLRNKQYREENKERIKQYREENKASKKQYYQENKKRIKQYHNKRIQTDPLYKMRCNISSIIRLSMRRQGYTKSSKTYQILGCDFETFKKHIERQFTKGMNWNNHGKWHYDHIIPISFAKTEEEIIKLNHYTNFQPLWAEDNIRKSNNIEPTQIKMRM